VKNGPAPGGALGENHEIGSKWRRLAVLLSALGDRFHDVPWTAGRRDAYEKDLANGLSKPANRI
jgi:hypothetical protein